jgi:hypothetical protein
MNQDCHGGSAGQQNAVAGEVAIHLEFSWIATADFVGLATTNNGSSSAKRLAWWDDDMSSIARGATEEAIQLDRHGALRAPRDDKRESLLPVVLQ